MLRRRRVWLCWALLCALPALVAVLLAVTGLAPPPGRGRRSCPRWCRTGSCSRPPRWRWCCRCSCRSPSRSWPGTRWRARPSTGMLRYLLVRPVGRLRLLVREARLGRGVRAARGAAGDGDVVHRRDRRVRLRRDDRRCDADRERVRRGAVAVRGGDQAGGAGARTAADRRLPGAVHARARRDRAVLLHAHRLAAGRRARRAGGRGDERVAAAARRRRGDPQFLPTTHWLAWVDLFRDPVLWRRP